MANAPAFDTLSYARRLKEAGVDEAQAEAHAEAVRDAATEGVATRADTARLEAKIDSGYGAVKGVLGFPAALTFAIAVRLFAAFQEPRGASRKATRGFAPGPRR